MKTDKSKIELQPLSETSLHNRRVKAGKVPPPFPEDFVESPTTKNDSTSDEDDSENEGSEFLLVYQKLDINKLIYKKSELKLLKDKLHYAKRKYIKYGYRANPNMTLGKATKTVVMCHCETMNIWTHLITALYFVA